jgi:hypothetical protein
VPSLWRIDIVVCRESYHTVVKRFVFESKPEIPVPVLFVPSEFEEDEIRLQKLAALDHVLPTRAFGYDWLSLHREERLGDIPVAGKLHE